jgi:hypothetical protein
LAAGDQYKMRFAMGMELDGGGWSVRRAMRERDAVESATPAQIAEEPVVAELDGWVHGTESVYEILCASVLQGGRQSFLSRSRLE